MKPIEERLWDYIDGTANAEEHAEMEQMLKTNSKVQHLYSELILMSTELQMLELDEPSMRFTQDVMDKVGLEPAPKALQTKIDQRIIIAIGGFFAASIGAVLVYAISQIQWTYGTLSLPFQMPAINWSELTGSAVTQMAMIVFSIAALYTVDRLLHHRKNINQQFR